jgi:hypothetical protein
MRLRAMEGAAHEVVVTDARPPEWRCTCGDGNAQVDRPSSWQFSRAALWHVMKKYPDRDIELRFDEEG